MAEVLGSIRLALTANTARFGCHGSRYLTADELIRRRPAQSGATRLGQGDVATVGLVGPVPSTTAVIHKKPQLLAGNRKNVELHAVALATAPGWALGLLPKRLTTETASVATLDGGVDG